MAEKKITASSIARMAGNIAGGFLMDSAKATTFEQMQMIAQTSVQLAYLIAEEVEKVEQAMRPPPGKHEEQV